MGHTPREIVPESYLIEDIIVGTRRVVKDGACTRQGKINLAARPLGRGIDQVEPAEQDEQAADALEL